MPEKISNKADREKLLEIFKQFRAGYENDKAGLEYSNRDELERKLQHGDELSDLDIHVLQVACANIVTDNTEYLHLVNLLD